MTTKARVLLTAEDVHALTEHHEGRVRHLEAVWAALAGQEPGEEAKAAERLEKARALLAIAEEAERRMRGLEWLRIQGVAVLDGEDGRVAIQRLWGVVDAPWPFYTGLQTAVEEHEEPTP